MNASGLDFQTLFSLLNAGASPSVSSEDLASRISSRLSPQTAGSVTDTEAICLCLTLSERITARLSSQSLPQDVSVYYEAVMGSLGEINLMEKLVCYTSCFIGATQRPVTAQNKCILLNVMAIEMFCF